MKKLIYLLLLPLALAVAACGGKNGSSNKESVLARQDSVDAHGLQRMQSSKAETDIKFKGRDYHSLVSRTPDESLPHVSNEMGDTYVDNKIVLRITRGSENVLNKTFTKNDFSSVVDAKFLSKSILEGIVYDKTTPEGIVRRQCVLSADRFVCSAFHHCNGRWKNEHKESRYVGRRLYGRNT